jgi:eukaryotic-like serine/threonine-protein kinase
VLAAERPVTETERLGRYQIIKHLAEGGMAEVLIGRATGIEGFERHVVLKRIRSEHARDQQFVRMFLDEARLAASLHHHNIVQVHDVGEERGEYFFAMEYVHGQDLRRLMMEVSKRDQLVPIEHVCTVILGAAAGLHHAHEQRGPDRKPLDIVHRDVSLSNIMLGFDGSVKVTDFGIAKAASTIDTRSDGFKGKIEYTSPEHCTGGDVDRRSDVFALGIVLYEIATSRRLFKGDTDFRTMEAIVHGEIPFPSLHRADLPPELEQIAMKALAHSPADRYQTADEMRTAVERFTIASNIPTSTTALADYMKRLFGTPLEPWVTGADADAQDDEYAIEIESPTENWKTGVVRPPTAYSVDKTRARRTRTRLAIGAAALVLAGVLGVVATTSSSESARVEPPSAAAVPAAPSPAPAPPPPPAPALAPAPVVATPESPPPASPKKVRKRPKKLDPNVHWDRDALFLDYPTKNPTKKK